MGFRVYGIRATRFYEVLLGYQGSYRDIIGFEGVGFGV